jgi:hypothetical protein
LVIARPDGKQDVGYRTISWPLVKIPAGGTAFIDFG